VWKFLALGALVVVAFLIPNRAWYPACLRLSVLLRHSLPCRPGPSDPLSPIVLMPIPPPPIRHFSDTSIRCGCPAFYTDVYSYISRIGSSLFLLVQVLVLLDFTFSFSERIIAKAGERDAALDAAGYVPGFCQNQWFVLTLLLLLL
jgi:hypothetical protein